MSIVLTNNALNPIFVKNANFLITTLYSLSEIPFCAKNDFFGSFYLLYINIYVKTFIGYV